MKLKALLLSAAFCACLAPVTYAQDLLIQNATVVTPAGPQADTDILIVDGRIAAIGQDLSTPDGTETYAGEGQWVSPGLFAPMSSLGLVEIGGEASTNDTRAAEAKVSVSARAVESFNPRSSHVGIARRRGITQAVITGSPAGHSIFAGIGMIANTSGEFESVIDQSAFVHVVLGETGANRAGGSRSAAMAQLRAALSDARNVRTRFSSPEDGDTLSRQDATALAAAARGAMPLVISANRASDLMNIVRLKRDIPTLDIIIVGATEAWQIADTLAANNIKVIIDPVANLPASFENLGARFENIMILDAAGVDYAISNLTSLGVTKTQGLAQHAGNAVGNGLDWNKAFTAISETPARWFGLRASRVVEGPLDDLVIWDGDPLEATSAPIKLWIDGEERSLVSRQTLLRDRYNPTSDDNRPHKYR